MVRLNFIIYHIYIYIYILFCFLVFMFLTNQTIDDTIFPEEFRKKYRINSHLGNGGSGKVFSVTLKVTILYIKIWNLHISSFSSLLGLKDLLFPGRHATFFSLPLLCHPTSHSRDVVLPLSSSL